MPSALAGVLSLVMVSGAFGYAGEVPANIIVGSTGDIAPGVPIPISATVLGPSGTGVPGVKVGFVLTSAPKGAADGLSTATAAMGQSDSSAGRVALATGALWLASLFVVKDVLSASSAITDANGVATVYLTLSAVAGTRVVTASTAGGVLGAISITLEPGSLPNTATSLESTPLLPAAVVLVGALGLLAIRSRRQLEIRG